MGNIKKIIVKVLLVGLSLMLAFGIVMMISLFGEQGSEGAGIAILFVNAIITALIVYILVTVKRCKADNAKLICPKCNNANIQIIPSKAKTTMNLNPIGHPHTLVNHKYSGKQKIHCNNCGCTWKQRI